MITTNDNGWIVGDAKAEPIERDCSPPPIPLYSCEKPSNYVPPVGSSAGDGDRLLLRPAHEAINLASPSPGYERSKILRGAVAQWVRSKWGEGATGEAWEPIEAKYDDIRPGLEALFAHRLWDRFDVIGSIVHFAIPRREACATVDLVVRFREAGDIGLISIWNGPDLRINPDAVWADLGAAAEAMEISCIPVSKLAVIYVSNDKIKLEAKSGEDVNGCIVKWFEIYKRANHIKAAKAFHEDQVKRQAVVSA